MRNYSITNLEQSKRLYYAGLKPRTADYIVISNFSKVDGVMNVTEKPVRIEAASDLKKAETNNYNSIAWSLGKLIHMMPNEIPSSFDENEKEISSDEPLLFKLVIDKNSIKYISDNHICYLSAVGTCLLDAVVEAMEMLLNYGYYNYDTYGEEEWQI